MRLFTLFLLLLAVAVVSCLRVPDDLTLVIEPFDGYRDGSCGFYGWQDNIVHIKEDCVLPAARYQSTLQHELCHAHQDFSIEAEFGQGLGHWSETAEGKSYTVAIQGRGFLYYPWGWSLVEDFATACSRYYTNREFARTSYPYRSAWMDENLAPLPAAVPPVLP